MTKWISVKERLPLRRIENPVLCLMDNKVYYGYLMDYWCMEKKDWLLIVPVERATRFELQEKIFPFEAVSKWAELPKPPEDE